MPHQTPSWKEGEETEKKTLNRKPFYFGGIFLCVSYRYLKVRSSIVSENSFFDASDLDQSSQAVGANLQMRLLLRGDEIRIESLI